jgi:hypothetical protein
MTPAVQLKLIPKDGTPVVNALMLNLAKEIKAGRAGDTDKVLLVSLHKTFSETDIGVPTHCKYPEDDQLNATGDMRKLAQDLSAQFQVGGF